jgi:predicted enzyme related to lactoylglutathione lyase
MEGLKGYNCIMLNNLAVWFEIDVQDMVRAKAFY